MESPTAKGALLTAGMTFMTAGGVLVTGKLIWEGVVVALVGAGFIFLREFLKVQ